MTPEQYEQWREDFGQHFPSVVLWFQKLPTETQDKQRELWKRVLCDVQLRDALAANWRIYNGDEEAIGTTNDDRERAASHVRRIALRLQAERKARDNPAPAEPFFFASKTEPKTGILATFQALLANGLSKEEAAKEVFGSEPGRPEPRYSCQQCRDSGIVDVWSLYSMRAYQAGALDDPKTWKICATSCNCQKGDSLTTDESPATSRKKRLGKFTRSQQYDPNRWCICPYGDARADVDNFRSWCAAFFERIKEEQFSRIAEEDCPPRDRVLFDNEGEADEPPF